MTDFLYPFIDAEERDAEPLLADLASSAAGKATLSHQLRTATLERTQPDLDVIAAAMAERFDGEGRLFAFGNGGSSTDAASITELFARPPRGRPLPARSLAADQAVVTALGNDVGFELVFSRQLIAYSRPGDMAVGFSTSGNSTNLIQAFGEARRRGLLTIGFAGYEGGQMAACPDLDHCLVVRSDSVHRIQETQAALSFALWSKVQERLGQEPAGGGGHGGPGSPAAVSP
ncbi:MAG: D-sedoheptulose-7-phosphate isomerase [Acidimicrobiales bacterium]